MELSIDPNSGVAPFEQIRGGILELVSGGQLAAGAKLPTVRALAEQLGVAPGTVARAFRELEELGIVETRGRGGTVVNAQGDATAREGQRAAREFADRMRTLGVSEGDALAWVTAALRS